jgi:hypothetical protein
MTPLQIATLVLRLAAVAWALIAIHYTYEAFVQTLFEPYTSLRLAGFWFYLAAHLGACALLWFFPTAIARKLVPSLADTPVSPPSPSPQWYTLGVMIIGTWMFTRAVPDVVYYIGLASFSRALDVSAHAWGPEEKAGVVATVAELVLGAALVLGARGWAEVLFRLRTLGMRERSENEAGQPDERL